MPTRLKQLKEKEKRTTTPSDLLADLHIYILPKTKWIPFRRLARNHVIEETVSAGFVRVSPTSNLFELRTILSHQLDLDFPQHYAFIRSVGRNFTQVKKHQEPLLKVKHFLPPQAREPEIHVLEVSADLVKKSGSVPNLLLSETDFSDQGTNSVLTGRLSQVDLDGSSRIHSRLFVPQGQLGEYGGHSIHEDRLRSYSSGREPGLDGVLYHDVRNGREGQRLEGTTDEEDYGATSESQTNKGRGQERLHSRGSQRSSSRRKKAMSESRLNRNTQSGNESNGGIPSAASRRKSEGVRQKFDDDPTFENDLRRSASFEALARPASQESLAEEADQMGLGYTERSRSRQMTRGSRPSRGRSISVSAIEGQRASQNGTGDSDNQSSQRVRSRSTGDYAPHRWRLEREARMLEKEIKIRTRLMEEELEAMREAQKAEEARRFEEELRIEEELYNQSVKDRKEPQSRTEILNLEGENPVVVVEEKPTRPKITDLQYPPEGATENQIVGRLIGDHNEGFEITYELEFSDEDDDEDVDENYDGEGNRLKRRDVKGKKNETITKRERDKHKKPGIRDGPKNNKNQELVNRDKLNAKTESKTNKGININNKREADPDKRLFKKEKGFQESNKNSKINVENKKLIGNSKKNFPKTHQTRKEAWDEQNDKTANLQTELQPERELENRNYNALPQDDIDRGDGTKKLKSSYHQKKRMPNTTSNKEQNVPKENIEDVRREREIFEDNRTNLFNHARAIHEKILVLKEKKRQRWWDEYNLARRKGARLEERQANLRQELEALYRKVLGALLRRQPLITGIKDEPSRKASYKISVIRLRHEIADLLRRVEAIDIKLQAELRLRQQAEREVKQLRSEVGRKKANVALSQSRAPILRNIAFIPDDILIRL